MSGFPITSVIIVWSISPIGFLSIWLYWNSALTRVPLPFSDSMVSFPFAAFADSDKRDNPNPTRRTVLDV